MKGTDRIVLVGIGVAALALVFWLLILSPKRNEANELGNQISDLKSSIDEQKQIADFGEQARSEFPRDYGRLVVLGKAVPADSDTASLMVELNRLSSESGVQFRSIEIGAATGTAVAPPTTPTTPTGTSTTGTSTTGTSTTGTSTTSTTPPAGTTTAPAPAAATSTETGTSTTAPSTTTGALPTEATASTLPIGATVGAAGLPTLPYKLRFRGDFFQVANFMRRIDGLIRTRGGNVRADGRLFTVDGFSLTGDEIKGFPKLNVWLEVTTYITPEAQGLFNGASPTAPAAPPAPSTEVPSTPASAEVGVTG